MRLYRFAALLSLLTPCVWIAAAAAAAPRPVLGDVQTAWVARYNAPGNDYEKGLDVVVDVVGNAYVTGGGSWGGSNKEDYLTLKYDPLGNLLWAAGYDGPDHLWDEASALALDGQGNVVVTGASYGSSSHYDLTTVKYDGSGIELWVQRYSSPGKIGDYASAMVVDDAGNVCVTGASGGDFVTIKYDASGNELWVARYNSPAGGTDIANDLALDAAGNVYVTGLSSGSATVKYDPNGNQLWVAQSSASARAIVVDSAGNAYITGESWGKWYDYLTIKYDTLGNVLWSASESSIGQNHDYPTALALDGNGGVVVTGQWDSFINGNYENHDWYTISYDAAGVKQWTALYSGPGDANDPTMDKPWDIVVDAAGNIYVTGSVDQNWFSEGTFLDYATVMYGPDGTLLWKIEYAGPGVIPYDYDIARALALDDNGNVYVTGYSYGAGTSGDVATIKYMQAAPLGSQVQSISLSSGGSQPWSLDAGAAHASELYLVLGSASGTAPGTAIPGGLTLPLNVDGWLMFTLTAPNWPPLSGSLGFLDGAGLAEVGGLSLPAGTNPALAGVLVHHAFVTFDTPSGSVAFVSNALPLHLVP